MGTACKIPRRTGWRPQSIFCNERQPLGNESAILCSLNIAIPDPETVSLFAVNQLLGANKSPDIGMRLRVLPEFPGLIRGQEQMPPVSRHIAEQHR
jgi:hypothetical protein